MANIKQINIGGTAYNIEPYTSYLPSEGGTITGSLTILGTTNLDALQVDGETNFNDSVVFSGASTLWMDGETSLQHLLDNKAAASHTHTSFGALTLTGNLTGQYLTGTWLQTTSATNLNATPSQIAVLNNGWVYYRTPSEILADIGASSSNHTHTCSITKSSSTNQITLAPSTKYSLTAGGNSFVFTTPGAKVKQTSLSSGTTQYRILASSSTSPTSGTAYEATYTNSVTLNGSGQITATSFYATSDMRKKENIKNFIPSKSILELPVVEFDFKETKVHSIGCLAQDLEKICPELVTMDEEGYLSINESKLVYLLLYEVKKLKEEINLLRR